MEAMLTVRLDAKIKQQGTQAMDKLGITPSAAVRKLFDYVVANEALPFEEQSKPTEKEIRKQIAAFDRCHTKRPLTMTDDELRDERLMERYGSDA
ncbi:MAG: type II toxin-antitoxin system RelB/DinJ family antitoxin [Eggerthellaceae bacterium]|nr:type II toxin-antitoxin system RelB/DinJ family antitoxin [Eggerthellaceae bacterium]